MASLVAQWSRIHLPSQEIHVPSPCLEDPLEKEMATHSSILAWEIPWTEEHSPWGCITVRYDLPTKWDTNNKTKVVVNVIKKNTVVQGEREWLSYCIVHKFLCAQNLALSEFSKYSSFEFWKVRVVTLKIRTMKIKANEVSVSEQVGVREEWEGRIVRENQKE